MDKTSRPVESPVATWWFSPQGERAATALVWSAVGLTAGVILVSLVASVKIRSLQSEIRNLKFTIEHRRVSLSPAEKVPSEQRATTGRGGILPPCPPRPVQLSIDNWQSAIEQFVADALWGVETERGTNIQPGDGGLAHGHLQQHEGHWDRGCEYLGVRWPWPEDTHDFEKAKAIAIANWRRDAWPKIRWIVAEELARRFRLPNDPYRAGNDEYWEKVVHELHGKELTAPARQPAITGMAGGEIAEVQR